MNNIIIGNIINLALNGYFDIIVHGCNCFNTMGAGLARQIKRYFPEAYKKDQETIIGDKAKFGDYTYVKINRNNKEFFVINAYTQYDYKGKGIKADYKAIQSVFYKINNEFSNKIIGIPLIGAGLAGGNWDVISNIIQQELNNVTYYIVKL